jgi:hypothetical protein
MEGQKGATAVSSAAVQTMRRPLHSPALAWIENTIFRVFITESCKTPYRFGNPLPESPVHR